MLATRQLLQTFRIFEGLSDKDLDDLCSKSQVRRYADDQYSNAGQEHNQVCLLFEGPSRYRFHNRWQGGRLYFVEPGDYCGELSVFDRGHNLNMW